MLLPIIMIILCLVGGGVAYFFMKQAEKNKYNCREFSIKTKSQLDVKRKKGDFIDSFAVYGYTKDDSDHNRLIIDEQAAYIVRDIFRWRIDGMSCQGIANRLNDMGILSPYEYKRECGMWFKTGFKQKPRALWSAVAVSRILKNEVYLGVLEQGKKTSKRYKVRERVDKSKDEWIRVENVHEPIVSAEDFTLVAQLLKHDVRVAPPRKRSVLRLAQMRGLQAEYGAKARTEWR